MKIVGSSCGKGITHTGQRRKNTRVFENSVVLMFYTDCKEVFTVIIIVQ